METARTAVMEAAENGAQAVSLPEMWNCPYSNDYFRADAEPEDGETVRFLSELASETGVYLIGGCLGYRNWMATGYTIHPFHLTGKGISSAGTGKCISSI